MSDVENVMTPEFRASFCNVFTTGKPMKNPDGSDQEPKYGITMLFGADADLSKLKAAAAKCATEKWGDNVPPNLRSPFRDQGEKTFDGYVAGSTFMSCSSKHKPGVVNNAVEAIIDPAELYSGAYCKATVRPYAYGGKGTTCTAGVAFGLQNVQKLRDGEPLAGKAKPEEEFEPVAVDSDASAGAMFD